MSERFKNKVAVVTGGNSGIGLATAKAFAREGAKVAIAGRSDATLKAAQKEIGADVLAIKADFSRVREIATAFDKLLLEDAAAALQAFFDETIATILKGAFFTVQKAIPLLTRGAAIVLNASISAHMGMPGSSVYGASKAAVVSLAKTLSADLLARGIRVNVVSPGPITTPNLDRMGLPEQEVRKLRERMAEQVPLKRFGEPDEIASAVLYLSSPESAYVVGTELVVDGGMIQL